MFRQVTSMRLATVVLRVSRSGADCHAAQRPVFGAKKRVISRPIRLSPITMRMRTRAAAQARSRLIVGMQLVTRLEHGTRPSRYWPKTYPGSVILRPETRLAIHETAP